MANGPVSAPGWPGIDPRWTSSAKSGVGTSVGGSRVWFTISHGILNEIYYPRVDSACTRDCGLIVTDGASYFSEEKRDTASRVSLLAPGVPAFHLENTATDGRYRIEKDIVTDPLAEVVLQRVRFQPLDGGGTNYRLHVLLAPHLNNHGAGNTAWVGDYKTAPVLFAERDGYALALACSTHWVARSVGFVGVSDGWQQLRANGRLTGLYDRAENGNVALTGEFALEEDGECVLAIGFGSTAAEAAQRAVLSLLTGFDAARDLYVQRWQRWHESRRAAPLSEPAAQAFFDFSAAMIRVHESKSVGGGVIASLSIPWGMAKGDNDLGGYHLVWPRDLVEAGGGLLAAGADEEVRRILRFLVITQESDGHWSQNMWLDGSSYWTGIQMDETALPILLVDLAWRRGILTPDHRRRLSAMVLRAAGFIVRNGPVTGQDRWEEDPGYSPFTLGAEIAALLIAADDAEANGQPQTAEYLRDTADVWFESIDDWMYVTRTSISQSCGVNGYYVRVTVPDSADAASPKDGFVPIKNRPPAESSAPGALVVSPDALALVRFGLRAADDPRMIDTAKVIDTLLKFDTPRGPAWHRYNGDGYGEHEDGSPFDGIGIGRGWPLLAGERAHYELAAGRRQQAEALARACEASAGESLLIPEQVWDADDIPSRELFRGEASGSARPLVWAHAEHLKLRRSLEENALFDRPVQTVQRYLVDRRTTPYTIWRFTNKIRTMRAGKRLRVEALAPATVRWAVDDWSNPREAVAVDAGLGIFAADLDTTTLPSGARVLFTFFWKDAQRWEGADFSVVVDRTQNATG